MICVPFFFVHGETLTLFCASAPPSLNNLAFESRFNESFELR